MIRIRVKKLRGVWVAVSKHGLIADLLAIYCAIENKGDFYVSLLSVYAEFDYD